MTLAPPSLAAADRFAMIVEMLCRAVAARGTDRSRTALIVLIWGRLRRMAVRFAAVAERVRSGTLRALRVRPTRQLACAGARPILPRGFAWLVRLVPEKAAAAGSQLQYLLNDPEMVALLAAAPRLGRILRPLCRMLGVEAPALPAPAPLQPAAPPERVPAVAVDGSGVEAGSGPALGGQLEIPNIRGEWFGSSDTDGSGFSKVISVQLGSKSLTWKTINPEAPSEVETDTFGSRARLPG